MRYEDFVIQIGSDRQGGYTAHVAQSPAGEGFSNFRLPYEKEEIGLMVNTLARSLGASRSPTVAAFRDIDPMTGDQGILTPRQVGDSLFQALFKDQVLSLYDRSLGRLEAQKERGLRIKIKLDPNDASLAALYDVPWEFLHRRSTQEFLALSRMSPIVRYLEVPQSVTPLPLPMPLRILAVLSSPSGLEDLNLDVEKHNLKMAWTGQSRVEIHVLKKASLEAMRNALLDKAYHVLHFMGHGGFLRQEKKGVLYFEKNDGSPEPISGEHLATQLRDFKSLRLVFFNACNTACASSDAGLNPFSGVATALVMSGLPAVLAMQLPISDKAAITFSRSFFRRLALGDDVDTAVVEGRLAIKSKEERTAEWGTPVLFVRVSDGRLFGDPVKPSSIPQAAPPKKNRFWMPSLTGLCILGLVSLVWFNPRLRGATGQYMKTLQQKMFFVDEKEDLDHKPLDHKILAKTTSPPESHPAGTVQDFTLAENLKVKMVWIPPGTFLMGSASDQGQGDERLHQVTLTQGRWMGQTEVTQEQWEAVMGRNPSKFKDENLPVERVSWELVEDFLFKVNLQFKGNGHFRLPTEAEWEYACRAGNEDGFDGVTDEMTWHKGNSDGKSHPPAQKEPNAWGLYDMHGNIWEWCSDWLGNYPKGKVVDPKGPASGKYKIFRGGSWNWPLSYCTSFNRNNNTPRGYSKELGFRLVRDPG